MPPLELPREAEDLLVDLAVADGALERARERVTLRQVEIAATLAAGLRGAQPSERGAAAQELSRLRRTTHRSELAQLAADVVVAERWRARILRRLDAFPQLGEVPPAVEFTVEHDGARGFVIRTGGGRTFRFSLPVMIFRGTWRAGDRYERGDAVAHDGSTWVAVSDAPAHEPGNGPDWRLAAMRGRNGRDAARSRGAP